MTDRQQPSTPPSNPQEPAQNASPIVGMVTATVVTVYPTTHSLGATVVAVAAVIAIDQGLRRRRG